jgi:hypothetical protein
VTASGIGLGVELVVGPGVGAFVVAAGVVGDVTAISCEAGALSNPSAELMAETAEE